MDGLIQTVRGTLGTPLELGATWFSDLHVNLLELIDELELTAYLQFSEGISLFQTKSFEPPQSFYIPAAQQPSYRIVGGTQRLIDRLVEQLGGQSIQTNKQVSTIRQAANHLEVGCTDGTTLVAGQVISWLRPGFVFRPSYPVP